MFCGVEKNQPKDYKKHQYLYFKELNITKFPDLHQHAVCVNQCPSEKNNFNITCVPTKKSACP